MAITNVTDTTFSIIKETASGTTPATPAFTTLNYKGSTSANSKSETDESDIVHASRANVDAFQKNHGSESTLELDLVRSTAMDTLFENALCGTFATNVLKAASDDTTITIEKMMVNGSANQYFRYAGSKCSEITIDCERDERTSISTKFDGFKKVEKALAIITGATYTAETYNRPARGSEVTVAINGVTANYSKMSLTIGHNLETVYKMGTEGGFDISTGKRSGKISIQCYRGADLSIDTVGDGSTPVSITVTIGSGTEGYSIEFPAAVSVTPATDAAEGNTMMIDLEFMSTLSVSDDTDVIVTKLS